MSMAAAEPVNKKRKLNATEDGQCNRPQSNSNVNSMGCTAQQILHANMNEIFATSMNIEELEQLSSKLHAIQAIVEKQQMSLISFDQLKDPLNPTETKGKLQKFIECVKWNVTNGDEQTDHNRNYFHVTSYGDFVVGPNKIKLHFWASIGDRAGEKDGEVYLGTSDDNLWEVEMTGEDTEIELSLENVQRFVERTGIKGIGKKQIKNGDEEQKTENGEADECWYTYHAFLNDLTEICLDLIETKSGESVYGDLDPDFNIELLCEEGTAQELAV